MKSRFGSRRSLAGIAVALFMAPAAFGHAFAPALLQLEEKTPGRVEVRFKQPKVRAVGSGLQAILPESCRSATPATVSEQGTGVVVSWTLECDGGLVGRRVGASGIAASQANVLLRVELPDGRSIREVLTRDRPTLNVPERQGIGALFTAYGGLGFEHILGGFDHLLFVFGLLLLVGKGWRLVRTVTAFTLGHSVTLALAAIGLLTLPQGPVEILIAFSILILAVELTRPPEKRWGRQGSFVLAASFGLLHGLGFAGALREAGLPSHDVPAALLAFNLGIELGQLIFLALVVMAGALLSRLADLMAPRPRWLAPARTLPVYGLGILAAFWTLERVILVWT